MAKYCGKVGYAETVETSPGVWTSENIIERMYRGDVIRNARRWENGEGTNDDLQINNQLEIVADAYAYNHIHAMRYAQWMGTRWKVTNVEVKRPRLILTIGGVYNGPTPETP